MQEDDIIYKLIKFKGRKIMSFKNPDTSKISDKKLYIFDMDGTIYLGDNVFNFAIRFINNLRAAGKRVLFFTNNASHSDDFYIEKLTLSVSVS